MQFLEFSTLYLVENNDLGKIIVGEDTFIEQKVNTAHFNINMLNKLKLHKMKVNIEFKKTDQNLIILSRSMSGDSTVNRFSNFCLFQNFQKFVRRTSNPLVSNKF